MQNIDRILELNINDDEKAFLLKTYLNKFESLKKEKLLKEMRGISDYKLGNLFPEFNIFGNLIHRNTVELLDEDKELPLKKEIL